MEYFANVEGEDPLIAPLHMPDRLRSVIPAASSSGNDRSTGKYIVLAQADSPYLVLGSSSTLTAHTGKAWCADLP